MSLAIDTYSGLSEIADKEDRLDLAWTLDERRFLRPDPHALAADELRAEAAAGLPFLGRYFVDDPYGAGSLGAALLDSLGLSGDDIAVFAGAGVGPMLAALAGHCRGGAALLAGSSYPDFPVWVERAGGAILWFDLRAGADALARRVGELRPALLYLEHPQFFARDTLPKAAMTALLEQVAAALGAGALILIDESNANYAPASASLAGLCSRIPSLIVLRGFSKAFQMGGLRLGLASAGAAAAPAVARLLPPLLAGAMALRIGRALLGLQDPAGPLRARIAEVRPVTEALVAARGIPLGPEANPLLPYLLLPADAQVIRRVEACGIRGKIHRCWSDGRMNAIYRLSIPLDPPRLSALRERLAACPDQANA